MLALAGAIRHSAQPAFRNGRGGEGGLLVTMTTSDRKDYLDLLAQLPRQPTLLPKWEKVCHELSRQGLQFAQELLAAGQNHFAAPTPPPSATP